MFYYIKHNPFLLDNKQEPNLPVPLIFPTDVHNKMSGNNVSQVIERHSFIENGSQLPKSKVSSTVVCKIV